MQLIWALDHGLQRTSKRMKRLTGVTGPQRLVLRILARLQRCSPGTIAKTLHVHPSTLTGVLRRLESEGLIVRRQDAADHRRALLQITAKGRRVSSATAGTVEGAVRRVLNTTPSGRLESARLLLERLAGALSA
jgi:DNA-binding MarR family transcriptional regulator